MAVPRDLAAGHVLGRALVGRPHDILYELARSPNVWQRRSAILATLAFIPNGDLDDAFALAAALLEDEHDATMPRTALRDGVERLGEAERARYLGTCAR